MSKDSGLSLIAVLIIVLLLIVVLGAIFYFTKDTYEKETIKMIQTDMLLIQGKTNIIGSQSTMNKDESLLKGTKLEEKTEEDFAKTLFEKGIINREDPNFAKYYVLTEEDLREMGLNTIKLKQDSYYIVNYVTEEIIYTKGIQDKNGEYYYTLSSIQERENK